MAHIFIVVLVAAFAALVLGACSSSPSSRESSAPGSTASLTAAGPEAQAWPVPTDAASYVPQFTVQKTEHGNHWILDHGQRVALLRQSMIGLFRQFPGHVVDEGRVAAAEGRNIWFEVPGLRLWTTVMDSRMSNCRLEGVPREISVDANDPAELVILMSRRKSQAEFESQVLRICYDRELARYVIRVAVDLQLDKPGGGEFCNFYAHGLGDFRPGLGRYDRLLYQDANDGNQLKAHHLSVQVPQPGPMRLAPGGLFGFVDEKDGNPVVIIEESTPQMRVDMCLCWFDAHLIWDEPCKFDPRDRTGTSFTAAVAGPPYRYQVKYKAYWLNPQETRELLAKAQTVSLAPFADRFEKHLPIDMNVVNDFEHTTDFISGNVKHIYFTLNPKTGIIYDTSVGHSGHCSIRFASNSDKGTEQRLHGPELLVTPGRQVKISAWVKTQDVTGEGFYLASGFVRDVYMSPSEQIDTAFYSAKLTGTHDWTLLEIPMPVTPANAHFLGKGRITFRLSGKGTAWVDDFVFAEQDAVAPAAR